MAQVFIDRPIFAWVIALFILVFGGVAIKLLPVAQFPTVAPPSIVLTAVYPGASAPLAPALTAIGVPLAGAAPEAAGVHGIGLTGALGRSF